LDEPVEGGAGLGEAVVGSRLMVEGDVVLEAPLVGLRAEAVVVICSSVPVLTVSRFGWPPCWQPANRHIAAAVATAATNRNRTDLPYSPDGWVIPWGRVLHADGHSQLDLHKFPGL